MAQRAIAANEPPELEGQRFYRDLGKELERESERLFPVPEQRQLVPLEEAARQMGRTVAEIQRLAEARLLFARREGDRLLVEPTVLSGG